METRDFTLKIKAAGDQADPDWGTFTGLAATWDLDQGGDRILPGAFTQTLQSKRHLPLLWQHNTDMPIGTVSCTETNQGLAVDGKIYLPNAMGKNAYELIKAKVISGLSIGYTTLQETYENGVRLLKELKLIEVSAVTLPMNESALIASVKHLKAMTDPERAKRIKSIDQHRRAIDSHQRAMREDLKSLLGDDLFGDDGPDDNTLDDEELTDDESKELLAELSKMTALFGD